MTVAIGFAAALFVGLAIALVLAAIASRPKKVKIPEGMGYGDGADEPRFGAVGRIAEQAMKGRAFSTKLADDLPRARIGYSPSEFIAAVTIGAATLALLFGALTKNPFVAIVIAIAAFAGARIFVRVRSERWRRSFDEQLPEALDLLAGSLEAGSSLSQAMELVADEGRPPLSEEFAQVLGETRLGAPLTEAMEGSVQRVGSRDYAWCLQAIRIQQEFGASLGGVLRTLAEFMRWRQELRREVSALTAEGRISAYVLIGLPFVVGFFFWLANPAYLGELVTQPVGWMLLGAAALFMTIGSLWMWRTVKVEV